MKSVRIVTIPPALLLAQLLLACSVGTEVGNGVKPRDPQSPETASNASSPGPADTATADNSNAPTSGSTSSAGGSNAPILVGGLGSAASGGFIAGPAVEPIFTNCASPFGSSTIASPATLSRKTVNGTTTTRDAKITANFSTSTQTWKVNDATTLLYRQLVLDPMHGAQAVTAYDAGFHAVNSGLTCGTVTTDTAATLAGAATVYTKLSVNLTNAMGQTFPLSWYLLPQGAGMSMLLKRIEIGTIDNSAPFILEAE